MSTFSDKFKKVVTANRDAMNHTLTDFKLSKQWGVGVGKVADDATSSSPQVQA
jgi:hypothetical protein